MILFVIGPFFRRRLRPPRPDDDIPAQPFFDFVAFWILAAVAAAIGAAGVALLIAAPFIGLVRDYRLFAATGLLAVSSAAFFRWAFVFWKRLR